MSRWTTWVAMLAFTSFGIPSSFAAKEPLLIAWPDLMPQQPQPLMPEDPEFADDTPATDQSYDPDFGGVVEHGMTPAAPGVIDPTDVVTEYNDVQVKIAGYVLPLDFEDTTVKEFLLVPYIGACIHVPPPPPNQIIYVTSEEGIEVGGTVGRVHRIPDPADRCYVGFSECMGSSAH